MLRSDGEMMPDISWNTPYLHGSYEKAEDNCKASLSYKVFLKGEEQGLTSKTFLQSCWTAAFDTACFVCDEAFDLTLELPVRLIGLGQHSVVPNPLTPTFHPSRSRTIISNVYKRNGSILLQSHIHGMGP